MQVKPDRLSDAVISQLEDYNDDVREVVDGAVMRTAKKVAAKLKSTSPKRSRKGKPYSKGWRIEETRPSRAQGLVAVIYNKNKPSLVHLLENGHQLANGDRVEGIPHVAPAEKMAQELFVAELERELGGGA